MKASLSRLKSIFLLFLNLAYLTPCPPRLPPKVGEVFLHLSKIQMETLEIFKINSDIKDPGVGVHWVIVFAALIHSL